CGERKTVRPAQHQRRLGDSRQRSPQAPGIGPKDLRLARRPALELDAATGDVPQGVLDVGLEGILAPAAEHAASVQVGVCGGTVGPVVATATGALCELV